MFTMTEVQKLAANLFNGFDTSGMDTFMSTGLLDERVPATSTAEESLGESSAGISSFQDVFEHTGLLGGDGGLGCEFVACVRDNLISRRVPCSGPHAFDSKHGVSRYMNASLFARLLLKAFADDFPSSLSQILGRHVPVASTSHASTSYHRSSVHSTTYDGKTIYLKKRQKPTVTKTVSFLPFLSKRVSWHLEPCQYQHFREHFLSARRPFT